MPTAPASLRPSSPVYALAEMGSPAAESLDVYLHLDALEELLEVIHRRDRYEAGGVLAGLSGHDETGPYVLVHRALHAHQARRERLALTFTAEVWEELWAAHERQCPELGLVGWYHSHPGLGVFLSEPDQFIHRHFFGAPHQIALVYDPDDFRWGVFYWEEGTLRAARGLYLYAEADRSYPALERALREVAPEGIILHDPD